MFVELNEEDLEVLREALRAIQTQLDIRRHKLRQAIESGPAEQVRSNSQELQDVLSAIEQLAETTSKFVEPETEPPAQFATPINVLAWVREFSGGRVINEGNMLERIRQLRALWSSSNLPAATMRLHELEYHIIPLLAPSQREELK